MQLALGDLASRARRSLVSGDGLRRISSTLSQKHQQEGVGGVIEWVLGGVGRLVGFVCSKLFEWVGGLFRWSFSALWGAFVTSVQFIWNFNWNASDKELEASVDSAYAALGGVLGGALGNAFGWLTAGAVTGAVLFSFNEALAIHVLDELGEEALEEIAANASNVVRSVSNVFARHVFTYSYINLRNAVLGKRYMSDSDLAEAVKGGRMTQDTADKNKKGRDAAEAQRKPWSFAKKLDEWVESLPDGFIQEFVEEFLEETSEAWIEAGYVVAGGADSFYAQQQLSRNAILGGQQTVEVQLSREPEQQASGSSTGSTTPASS